MNDSLMQPFCALDIETANQANTGICQIGIAYFHNGSVADTWSQLLNPGCEFARSNIRVHGITGEMTRDMPMLADVHGELKSWLDDQIVVSHTFFDKRVLSDSIARLDCPPLRTTWLDSCQIARFSWRRERKGESFSLKALADWLGISFRHHDALEDAIVAGKITVSACAHADISLDDWIARSANDLSR
ncbi:MAG: exonuclease domain-containing protein [Rhodobacteraceae bacterium]|nr:exonuclease domain-containing protein [Paracoccaceae bacterium]